MSTKINIIIGGEDLLDKAKLDQQIGRESLKQKEADSRVETQATITRASALAARNLDANGKPLTGANLQKPQTERRPAASRSTKTESWNLYFRQEPIFLDFPSDGFVTRFESATGDLYKGKKKYSPRPSEQSIYAEGFWVERAANKSTMESLLLFVSKGGPNDTNCIRVPWDDDILIGSNSPAYIATGDKLEDALVYRPFPERPRSFSCTIETDIKMNDSYSYTCEIMLINREGETIEYRFAMRHDAGTEQQQVYGAFYVNDASSGFYYAEDVFVPIITPNRWSRIAYVINKGRSMLFFDGVLVASTNQLPPRFFPINSITPIVTVATHSPGFIDVGAVVVTATALYTANYTPRPFSL